MLRNVLAALLALSAGVLGGMYLQQALTGDAPAAAHGAAIDWREVADADLDVASVFLVARERGARAGLDSLTVLTASDSALRLRGHDIAHALGRYVFRQRGGDLSVFLECREVFQAGCYHGVLEAYFATHPAVDSAAIARLCPDMIPAGSPPLTGRECAHGLGHGLMGRFGGDLTRALQSCEWLEGEATRRECYDGAFMERAGSASRVAAGGTDPHAMHGDHAAQAEARVQTASAEAPVEWAVFNFDDPAWPCTIVDARHQPSCWSYQPILLLSANGNDAAVVMQYCEVAGEENARACAQGLSKQYMGRVAGDLTRGAAACAAAPSLLEEACTRGLAEYFLDLNWRAEATFAQCAALPGDQRASCATAVAERIALVYAGSGEREAACGEAPDVEACMLVANGVGRGADARDGAG